MAQALLTTNVANFPVRRGKVRDIYDIGDNLIIVATDRISAFDCVLAEGIPDRGRVLTQMTEYWCEKLNVISHYVHCDIDRMPEEFQRHRGMLDGRVMCVEKTKPFPVECVVRGFLSGNAWEVYRKTGSLWGEKMPEGLKKNAPLGKPFFTPTTKSKLHDEPMTYEEFANVVGKDYAAEIEEQSIECYKEACEHAWSKGIIIADTKFEWGLTKAEQVILIDEVITPDSSRFWPVDNYNLGVDISSFDKQFIRDFLINSGWISGKPPELTDDVIGHTRDKYLEAYYRLIAGKLIGLQV